MPFYPPKIRKRSVSPQNAGVADGANAVGTDASFTCGSFVRFSLRIDPLSRRIADVRFQTNGCGFMIAAADVLADAVAGKLLAGLHGLDRDDLRARTGEELGTFPADRRHCEQTCIRALRAAFADYRASQIEEFQGEKALICTCFGVSEVTIELHVEQDSIKSVDEVTRICNAGGGCGSCRMLIQEIIDIHWVQQV